MHEAFKEQLKEVDPLFVGFDALQTVQVNVGDLCNLRCSHCHVGASPSGTRSMGEDVMETLVRVFAHRPGLTLDVTGGCPELAPLFRPLIERTEGLAARRIVRSNLTVITEPGMEWLPAFYRRHRLVVVASLPCYLKENVDRQRGDGVYDRSIEALRRLNDIGYGDILELNLVYNPGGDFVPGSQGKLAAAYRKELGERWGIRFNDLYTITNAPIGRFREHLEKNGAYARYMSLLARNFNAAAAGSIMCRSLVSIGWDGRLYNCDFNQAVGLPIMSSEGRILTIHDLEEATANGKEIRLGEHCYSCTAGEGSSCTGALAVRDY